MTMVVANQVADRQFSSLARQVSKWVDQVSSAGYRGYQSPEGWSPHLNFCEDAANFQIVVDLAGVVQEDMENLLRIEEGMLIISGVRESPGLMSMEGQVRIHHMEINHGRFCRAIRLPKDVDVGEISATYRNGFLWIRIPKQS